MPHAKRLAGLASGLASTGSARRPPPPAVPGVRRGARHYVPSGPTPDAPRWSHAETAGRLVELSAPRGPTAVLTVAAALLRDAQRRGETTGWCGVVDALFFPPDLAAGGVDLAALAIFRAPALVDVPRAAERLLRSGAFGLVVLDLVAAGSRIRIPAALLNRIAALAREHEATALCLTEKPDSAPSLGPLVSLRASARRGAAAEGGFAATLDVLRDRRRPERWTVTFPCVAPEGTEPLLPPPPPPPPPRPGTAKRGCNSRGV